MNPNTMNVSILDKEYLVACPQEERLALQNAAILLDTKMKEIRASGKVYGTERIAVMAALNMTHELLQTGEKTHHFDATLEAMQQRIDAAINDTTSP